MSQEEVKKSPVERYLDYQSGCQRYFEVGLEKDAESEGKLSRSEEDYHSVMPITHRIYFLKRYLGILLTSIEVIGLPERQEKAFKDVIKKDFWNFVEQGFVVPPEIDEELTPSTKELIGDALVLSREQAKAVGIDVDKIEKEETELINI